MPHPSVLIAGAGPSGLVLALILLKNGVPVRIIDKERTHRIGSRGAGIMPRTLELYTTLGVLDDILKDAIGNLPTAAYDFGELVPKSTTQLLKYQEPTPDVPYSNGAALSQDRHEEILRAHLAKLCCMVELGTELRSFEQPTDGMQSEETANFGWLVGTDGAHSVVRKQLGLSFLGETRTEFTVALGDIVIEEGLDLSVARKEFGFIYKGHVGDELLTRDEFVEEFYTLTGRRDIKFGEATWLTKYTANIRMVDTMRQGRAFVAGDAAHCHSPAGGQGLNSSVQDAANLGWKLALVHKGLAPTSLLDTYSEERLRVITHMLGIMMAMSDKTLDKLGKKDAMMQQGDSVRMLGVNYRGSSIVCEEEGAAGAAYRALDAPELVPAGTQNAATRLFEVFSTSAHTVLVFGGDAEARAPMVDALARIPRGVMRAVLLLGQGHAPPRDAPKFDAVLEDRAGHAYRGYGVDPDELTVVVVRPDGVVGIVASNAEGVERYFQKILIAA
ncbi:hypothetical protein DFH09DRAFT_1249316 [Mycena vulgaris]|nr:hypothetical protein DFH09DRAFT_1249316 [Mycena vulgaris]